MYSFLCCFSCFRPKFEAGFLSRALPNRFFRGGFPGLEHGVPCERHGGGHCFRVLFAPIFCWLDFFFTLFELCTRSCTFGTSSTLFFSLTLPLPLASVKSANKRRRRALDGRCFRFLFFSGRPSRMASILLSAGPSLFTRTSACVRVCVSVCACVYVCVLRSRRHTMAARESINPFVASTPFCRILSPESRVFQGFVFHDRRHCAEAYLAPAVLLADFFYSRRSAHFSMGNAPIGSTFIELFYVRPI